MTDQITGMYEVLEAIEAVVEASDPSKRAALAKTMDAYSEDFPDEFFWAIGPQSPVLLHHIMFALMPGSEIEKQRRAQRLIDRKPEGNA
jgi:hypothetical protein